MLNNQALIELALKVVASQNELATKLGVSKTQISKWKNDSKEHMSEEMEKRLRKLTKIGERDPRFVQWAGSTKQATKWETLIHHLAEEAQANVQTGYHIDPLDDDDGLLCWHVTYCLTEMGVAPPTPSAFPAEFDALFAAVKQEESKQDAAFDPDALNDRSMELAEALAQNPYASTILSIFESLGNVYSFYQAYVHGLVDDLWDEVCMTQAENIRWSLPELAASKIDDVDETFAPKFKRYKFDTAREWEGWLTILKETAIRAKKPIPVELLDMISDEPEELGEAAEREHLGFNKTRVHPDVYMNELLVGMRIIHQALPAIMKKLGIDAKEFTLDESELRLGSDDGD
jgi:transcriptional regulator with XRE-family HTH domain